MHESSSGLRERPFPAAPLPAAYFPAESNEHARLQLARCIERAEGAAVVIGAPGTGKSLLLQILARQFGEHFRVALLAGTAICTRRALLQNILFELQLPYRGMEEGELRLSLIDHLQPSRQCPSGMLLLIDEAHTLPTRLLEEVRLLTNLVREGSPRVRLVLAGSPALEERLAGPKLESLHQRVAVRTYLQPLTNRETGQYIQQELARCGEAAPFTCDAQRAVHTATAGIPRLINQVCRHALTLAAADQPIDGPAIEAAWADLQQLPAPWNEPTPAAAAIEFGTLDDEPVGGSTAPSRAPAAESTAPSHDPDDLFGNDFTDEEIVLDRYSVLDAAAVVDPPRVSTPAGQAFAREVAIILPVPERPALKLADLPAAEAGATRSPGPLADRVKSVCNKAAAQLESEDGENFSAVLDPVYPEQEAADGPSTAKPIMAIDQAQSPLQGMHTKAASGRFRHLFATLRGKKPQ